ncbi:FUSC family protein [Streptomyces sp. NPDC001606]
MLSARWSALAERIGRTDCVGAARATVAAGLTWQICATLLHSPDPYPGAVAALLTVEATVVRTVAAAARYAAGCLLGVLLAVPAALYVHPGMVGLALVVFASVLPVRHGFLGHHGLHVPTTALITFALVRGRHPGELASHLTEIVLGIAFGLACSALLFPAVRVRSAERALAELRHLIARDLDALADAVVRREPPRQVLGAAWERDLETAVARARGTVDEAHESVRWNVRPAARRRRWHLDHRVLRTLGEVAEQATATGRLLDGHRPHPGGPTAPFDQRYARLLRTTALCVYSCRGGGRPHPALPAARHALARLDEPAPGTAPGTDPSARDAHPRTEPPAPGTVTDPRTTPPAPGGAERRLVRQLDAALACLAAPAPARPARPHRVLAPLRPASRR